MELQFITLAFQTQITNVIAALPQSYFSEPKENKIVESIEVGFFCIQDWVFTQGFVVAKES